MAENWRRIASEVEVVLRDLGRAVTVRRQVAPGILNPISGLIEGRTVADHVFVGVDVGREDKLAVGATIARGNRTLYLNAGPIAPIPGDFFVDDAGREIAILHVDQIRPAADVLAYRIEVAS